MLIFVKAGPHSVYVGTPEHVASLHRLGRADQPGRCMRVIDRLYGRTGLVLGVLADAYGPEINRLTPPVLWADPIGSRPLTQELELLIKDRAQPWKYFEKERAPEPEPARLTSISARLARRKPSA
jgi:hypothetical protein